MSAVMTFSVSLGRNIGDNPMPAAQWSTARAAVRAAVTELGAHIFDTMTGPGEWPDEVTGELIYEDSSRLTFELDAAALPALRDACAILARDYSQQAVGLVVGHSELIAPAPAAAIAA